MISVNINVTSIFTLRRIWTIWWSGAQLLRRRFHPRDIPARVRSREKREAKKEKSTGHVSRYVAINLFSPRFRETRRKNWIQLLFSLRSDSRTIGAFISRKNVVVHDRRGGATPVVTPALTRYFLRTIAHRFSAELCNLWHNLRHADEEHYATFRHIMSVRSNSGCLASWVQTRVIYFAWLANHW